ncbi:MAG TPA: hypothetical protein VJ732_00430 [Bryobacteraceae bacterium]|nr:hypothetical protein [Bryobacteraceae bacterium]
MRALSSAVMAIVVTIALFWGNCFSCPQLLLALHEHQPAHQCCHKTSTTPAGCQLQVLGHFVKADIGAHAPPVAVLARVPAPAAPVFQAAVTVAAAEYSPPDLLSLHSTLRI